MTCCIDLPQLLYISCTKYYRVTWQNSALSLLCSTKQKIQVKLICLNVAFKMEMEGRENVTKEMSVFLKTFSICASEVCQLR